MFLLLIFFMVSSTFSDGLGIDVTLPTAESSTRQEAGPYEITVTKDGDIYFQGEARDEDELYTALEAALKAEPELTFVLRADEEADFGRVVLVIDTARRVGGDRIIIPTAIKRPDPDAP